MHETNGPVVCILDINVVFFNPGVTASLPQGRLGNPVSSIDMGYKLLDERGALLAEWQDRAHSIKGGTYCARTLNRRAVVKINGFFLTPPNQRGQRHGQNKNISCGKRQNAL